jgi:hypothetical protein
MSGRIRAGLQKSHDHGTLGVLPLPRQMPALRGLLLAIAAAAGNVLDVGEGALIPVLVS